MLVDVVDERDCDEIDAIMFSRCGWFDLGVRSNSFSMLLVVFSLFVLLLVCEALSVFGPLFDRVKSALVLFNISNDYHLNLYQSL